MIPGVPLRVLVARLEHELELANLALRANEYSTASSAVENARSLAEQIRELP